jgi:magnesium-transporting ATPase (P-type)
MKPEERTPFWQLVLEQFEDKLVRILLLAAVVSFVLLSFFHFGLRVLCACMRVVLLAPVLFSCLPGFFFSGCTGRGRDECVLRRVCADE